MKNETIKCPECGCEIPVKDALTQEIQATMEKDFKKKESILTKKEAELKEIEDKIKSDAAAVEATVNELLKEKLKDRIGEIQKSEREQVESELKEELKDLQEQIEEKGKKLSEAQKNELELRKKARELEEKEKTIELQIERKLSEERNEIESNAQKRFAEEHHLKDLEKDKKIDDMKKALEEARKKAEQGSMQTQGEVLELDLESALKSAFPQDEIIPVPKGKAGADVIQVVKNKYLKQCGSIIWEYKSTKNWSNGWIQKLKKDSTEAGANIPVIVTEAMPKEIDSFGFIDGVWVTKRTLAIPMTTLFRQKLIEISYIQNASVGKNEKMEILHQYLVGPDFRQKMEAIIETFQQMKVQLDKEKTAMQKLWKQREKQIDLVVVNTAGMYGDLQGLLGTALPDMEALELGADVELKQIQSDDVTLDS